MAFAGDSCLCTAHPATWRPFTRLLTGSVRRVAGRACLLTLLALLSGSIGSSPLWAQGDTPAAKANVNPEHEKIKGEAEIAYRAGNFAKGIELANSVLAENPQDHVALYLRASCRVELGQARRDVKEIRAGVEDSRQALANSSPDMVNYYLPYLFGMTALAHIENRKEHAEICIKIANSVLGRANVKNDQKANVLYQRAGGLMFLGSSDAMQGNLAAAAPNFEAASKDYRQAIEFIPSHLGAHVGLAESLAIANKPDEAEAAYTAAIGQFPANPLVYNNRGIFLQQRGKMKEAIEDFTKALQLDSKYFVGFTNRGYVHLQDGQPAAAEADFDESLKINAQQPLVYSLRGAARVAQGRVNEAIQDYSKVIELEPQNPVALADIGFARFFGKDYAGALQALSQAYSMNPAQLRYLNPWRYWTMFLSGQPEPARQLAAESVAKAADKRDWFDKIVLFLDGQLSEQDFVNGVVQTDPNLKNFQTCEAYFFIAERRRAGGDPENAAQFYRLALETKARHLSAFRGSQYAVGEFSR